MDRRERIALWAVVVLLLLAWGMSTALLYGEIVAVREQMDIALGIRPGAGTGAWEAPALPTPENNVGQAESWGSALTVRAVAAAQPLTGTAVITLAVRGSGAADPLLDLPLLDCEGQRYPVEGASLEAARRALLDLITWGEASASLTFTGGVDLTRACTLLLNPDQPAASPIAPRIVVPVPRASLGY